MKMQSLVDPALNTLTGYGAGYVEINRVRHAGPVLVSPQGEVRAWALSDWAALSTADFEAMLALAPEVVLLGTGSRQRFAHPRLHACLSAARIGLECMDTGAACRTYNILMAEGRRVLAALIPPAD
ncbi:MAG: Mth938-like domain-containing protein [Betaproteobacteria bacterium]|nr:Mth938-like domain-containing protein [Betaproteobacteria bacterium]